MRRTLLVGLCVAQWGLAGCSTLFHGRHQAMPVAVRNEVPAHVRIYTLTTGEAVAGPAEVPTQLSLARGDAAAAPKLAVISLPGYCPRYKILEGRFTKLYEIEESLALLTVGTSLLFAAADQWLGGAFRYAPERLRTGLEEGACEDDG